MLKELYEEVQGIVYKCRNEYYLHLWELSDWDQEGYLFHETLRRYRKEQSKEKQEELERVLRNERFRGRQRVLRDLRIVFQEFDIRTH